jgi:hypothetical protein
MGESVRDVLDEVSVEQGTVHFLFDVDEVVNNLRCELYRSSAENEAPRANAVVAALYYWVRPLLPVGVRK